MKLAWMCDLHLDDTTGVMKEAFLASLRSGSFDAAAIAGDISGPESIRQDLVLIGKACAPRPVFFVLGNHDMASERGERILAGICRMQPNLRPFGPNSAYRLTRTAGLIGHSGDYRLGGAKASADYFRRVLPQALLRYGRLLVLTHVPPFEQAIRFSGRPVERGKQHYFHNPPAGRVIAGIAKRFSNRRLSVLAGHTHCRALATISPTVEIRVGAAQRGSPKIEDIIEIP